MFDKRSLLVLALVVTADGYSGVHKCKDADGNILYTDKVCTRKHSKSAAEAQTKKITVLVF